MHILVDYNLLAQGKPVGSRFEEMVQNLTLVNFFREYRKIKQLQNLEHGIKNEWNKNVGFLVYFLKEN